MRLWGLLAIILSGLLLRVTRLGESLWYDEIASWQVYCAAEDAPWSIIGHFNDPINHVLSNLLVWFSVNWLAPSVQLEAAFRLPALFFSLLAIVAMHGLGAAAGGARVGFIAAGLMAMLPVTVLEGAEARGYSMMICFAALATWMFQGVLSRKRPATMCMAYAVMMAMGIWSQFVTVYVAFGHAAWLGWRAVRHHDWPEFWRGLAALALAAIIALALYAPMIPSMLKARGMFVAQRPDQPRIFSIEGWHALLQLGGSWYWWAAWPGLLLVMIGFGRVLKDRREAASGMVVALSMLGLPLMLTTVALSGSWVYARFTLFAFPGAVLLMALGVDDLWRRRPIVAYAAMVVVIIASLADLWVRPPKQPLRDAMEHVRAHQSAGDEVLAVGLAHPVSLVYADDVRLSYTMQHGAKLAERLAESESRWIIVEYPRSVQLATYALIEREGFIEAQRFPGWADWGNGEIIVYRRK